MWFYPIQNKSHVGQIFVQFKSKVEKYFQMPIVTIYSNGGGEYKKLYPFFAIHGINHLTTPPYTPQHIGLLSEDRAILLKLGEHYCIKFPCPFIFGLMHLNVLYV